MATEQIAVRLPELLLAELDELIAGGTYASRAAVVRAGIEAVMEQEKQREIDAAIVEGYTRRPPTATEDDAALASLRSSIMDEPW